MVAMMDQTMNHHLSAERSSTVFIVDLPIQKMVIFHSYATLPEGKSHKTPLNHHFPMVSKAISIHFP